MKPDLDDNRCAWRALPDGTFEIYDIAIAATGHSYRCNDSQLVPIDTDWLDAVAINGNTRARRGDPIPVEIMRRCGCGCLRSKGEPAGFLKDLWVDVSAPGGPRLNGTISGVPDAAFRLFASWTAWTQMAYDLPLGCSNRIQQLRVRGGCSMDEENN